MSEGSVLALFDFDKTLVSRDSFRLFGDLAARSNLERALLFGAAAITKLRWMSNAQYKEHVLRHVWATRTESERAGLLEAHAIEMEALAIEPAWARLHAHLEHGDHVAVLSASPRFYLEPVLAKVSQAIEVHASDVTIDGTKVSVDNLFREAKGERAAAIIERIEPSRTIVYTDHRDDIPLMKLADHVVLVRPEDTTRQRVGEAGIEFEVLG
ncbi:MAG: HAD family hydrolase [Myxococcota bacterium]|jgi:HAD superfamily phosphoserine phosphatase-like hydrolase|nr:HAD family hydrolase [Myxococcota bacterium]